jgi:hypothetical protein
MGLGSKRPNTADDKMIAALERGTQDDFKDRKPPKQKEDIFLMAKEAQKKKTQDKNRALKALRLAAQKGS